MSGLATAMRYRDVAAASDWLCAAFGFQQHLVVAGETGTVHYVQLTFGDAMFMLAPVRDAAIDRYMRQPDEIGGAETQSCYLVVGDADAHHAGAKASGAEIILDLQDDDLGGRGYSCRDPEGHIWSFGTHDPWRGKRPDSGAPTAGGARSRGVRPWIAALGLLAAVAASAAITATLYGAFRQPEVLALTTTHDIRETVARETEERAARAMQERLGVEQQARETAERSTLEAREQLVRESTAKVSAERALEHASKRLEEAVRAKDVAEGAMQDIRRELGAAVSAKTLAEAAASDADRELQRLRTARQPGGADLATVELRQQLDGARAAKEAAEREAAQASWRAGEEAGQRQAAEHALGDMRAQLDGSRAMQAAAELTLEQLRRQLAEQLTAREAAERVAKEASEQLSREQRAKSAAWKAAAQLRRQLSRVQSAQEPVADVASSPEPEADAEPPAKKVRARPKQKRRAKAKAEQ